MKSIEIVLCTYNLIFYDENNKEIYKYGGISNDPDRRVREHMNNSSN